tara:strand:- start:139 stop:849 length:711 start_codon:yes stop_codon:yes gene_type:complete
MADKIMKVKQKSRKNIKKRFFDVEAPMTANKISLYGTSVEELDGSVVKLDLTRSLRGKSMELKMRVKVEGEGLKGRIISLKLVQGFIRRATRRGTDYVEDSFKVNTKDDRVRIKPFLITRKRVSRAVRNALRESAKKFLEGYLKARTSDEISSDIISNKLQKGLSVKLKKIYPLAMSEIRIFEVLGEKSVEEEVVEEVKEEEVVEEKKVEEVKEEKPKKETKKKIVKKEVKKDSKK